MSGSSKWRPTTVHTVPQGEEMGLAMLRRFCKNVKGWVVTSQDCGRRDGLAGPSWLSRDREHFPAGQKAEWEVLDNMGSNWHFKSQSSKQRHGLRHSPANASCILGGKSNAVTFIVASAPEDTSKRREVRDMFWTELSSNAIRVSDNHHLFILMEVHVRSGVRIGEACKIVGACGQDSRPNDSNSRAQLNGDVQSAWLHMCQGLRQGYSVEPSST